MDETLLETFQEAVEMRDVETLMCFPHTNVFKDTFIDDFSTMNPAEFAESLVETFIDVLEFKHRPCETCWARYVICYSSAAL